MGIFGKREQFDLSDPGEMVIAEHVAAAVPDVGEYFLDLMSSFCDSPMYARLKADIDSRRAPNGWVVGDKFTDVPPLGRKQTPMSLLRVILGEQDVISLTVWATAGNRGKYNNAVEAMIRKLLRTQGHAAAAAWAITAQPEAPALSLRYLSKSLSDGWYESSALLRNNDVIKAFRNWNK